MACLVFAAPAKSKNTGTPETRIANGTVAGKCALPAVVDISMGNHCTGTLIHPQVVLYATHCRKLRRIILGENGQGPVITDIKASHIRPDFDPAGSAGPNGAAIDWGVAVLSKPVKGVPIIPLAYGGELEKFQKSGQKVILAGYGKTDFSSSTSPNLRWTTAEIEQVSNGSMTTVKGSQNACEGDSGGPVLVQLEDGSWRTIGITTNLGPTLPDCGKDTGYNRISQVRPEMVKWLEEKSGFDLTPCYDQDGKIDKSPECKNFFAGDIQSPSGSWKNNCADSKVVKEPKLTPVGSGEDENTDTDAPKVKIKGVKDGDTLEVGDRVKIEVTVKDDSEIKEVSLSIDDKEVKSWEKPPFTYTWKVKKAGDRVLLAIAKDVADNSGESEELEVAVEDPNADKTDDDTDSNPTEEGDDGTSTKNDGSDDKSTNDTNTESSTDDTKNKKDTDDDDDDDDDDESSEDDDPKSNNPGKTSPGGCSLSASPSGMVAFGLLGLVGIFRRRRPTNIA